MAAGDLARSLRSAEIVAADADAGRARAVASRLNRYNVSWMRTNASNHGALVRALARCDIVVGALPGAIGFAACRAAVQAGVHMVGVSYMPEGGTALHRAALKARVCIVPDCGVSPGMSNIYIGRAVSRLDRVESVRILVGGLPDRPVAPLGYVITWSADDLIDLYERPATIRRHGQASRVEAMTGLQTITVLGLGPLEAFYSDGLRTLLHTIPGATEMWEKTLRYPGHAGGIRLLRSLGFFSASPVQLGGVRVRPREVTARLFDRVLRSPRVRDLVILIVAVGGLRGGRRLTISYRLLDRYDPRKQTTDMARTTAFTAAVVAQLIARGMVEGAGVVPPETLGMDRRFFGAFQAEMRKRGIVVVSRRRFT